MGNFIFIFVLLILIAIGLPVVLFILFINLKERIESLEKIVEKNKDEIPRKRLVSELKDYKKENNDETFETVSIMGKDREAVKDWENEIGSKWFYWIGIFAFLVGVGFFLKYAFDNNWFNEIARIIIGFITGILFLVTAERLKRKFRYFSLGFCGIGISIFYLSIYTANNFYHLLPYLLSFGIMVLITILGTVITLRFNSLFLAFVVTLGGFLTPIILRGGEANALTILLGLCTYILILDLGILGLAFFKKWRSLNIVSFLMTVGIFSGWYINFYNRALFFSTMFYLFLFYFVFVFILIVDLIKRRAKEIDFFLLIGNAVFAFSFLFVMLKESYPQLIGVSSISLAAVYFTIAVLLKRKRKTEEKFILSFLGVSLIFLTITFPFHLERHFITIAWAVEMASLLVIGIKLTSRSARIAAFILFVVILFRLFVFDVGIEEEVFMVIMNFRVITYLLVIASLFFSTFVIHKFKEKISRNEFMLYVSFPMCAIFLIFLIFSLEVNDYFNSVANIIENYSFVKQLVLTLGWIAFSATLMVIGLIKGVRLIRYFSIAAFGFIIAKVFLFDLSYLRAIYRFLSLLVMGAILILVSFGYHKRKKKREDKKK
jgi:uncharacterized membrane protein